MILLDVDGIRKHFGPEAVLDGVKFQVRPGERIGLVGPNGSGKTTLMKIIAGREEADAGNCLSHASLHLEYLEQQPQFAPDRTLRDEAAAALAAQIALQREAEAVAAMLAEAEDAAERQRLSARFDYLQGELQRQDAYNLDHKIERVLLGLGFGRDRFAQPVGSLSGGEQNRLLLGKLLLAEPNLMLLDEPSNHLDIAATEWLEQFLVDSSAAMIVVSHDRYFLDKVTTRTLELFRGTVDSYAGNFSAYSRQKAERLVVERRTYDKQQAEIAKIEDFIRRNAYGQKHAQAEDRRKKLARIEPVPPPREITPPPMRFPEASRSGDIVVRAEGLAKGYQKPLFSGLDAQIVRGQRWAILGPNGSGKTTLLGCLLGLVEPDQGTVRLGTGVDVGYFDQHLTELADHTAVVDAIRPAGRELEIGARRSLLARFGLTGDTVLQTVDSLSGGERCRAALARLAAAEANLLVLDEPTNHLDLWARDALEDALRAFDGTVLLVSHDRYFIDRVANHVIVIEAEGARLVQGNYTAYQLAKESAAEATVPTGADEDKPSPERRAGRQNHSRNRSNEKKRPRRFPYRKVADLEEEIFQREAALEDLHRRLACGETHRDADQVRQINAEIASQRETLATLYEHWDEATELNW